MKLKKQATMVLSIYAVTYASYGAFDGKLYTETKIFVDKDKAIAYHQQNIRLILEDNDNLTDSTYDEVKDNYSFDFESDGWCFSSKLEVTDYEFYLQERK